MRIARTPFRDFVCPDLVCLERNETMRNLMDRPSTCELPAPDPAVLCRPVSTGAVLLHTQQEIYFGLNPVGLEIWQLLHPVCRSVDEVCERLLERYPDVPIEALREDVLELLGQLVQQGLAAYQLTDGS